MLGRQNSTPVPPFSSIILTIFPGIFSGFLETSLLHKARQRGLACIELIDIRSFAPPPHYQVDDVPFGGGAGMVMKPEPLVAAINAARQKLPRAPVILLSPAGKLFNQGRARDLSARNDLILVCGRYEGVDQRAIDLAIDEELSIGDYVLMGGEVAAMVVLECIVRLRPGVVGNEASTINESFERHGDGAMLLEAPHYTRPAEFQGQKVPEVLLSGDHKKIETWRDTHARERTKVRRPDLL